jgi:hypothetical protein
MSEVSFRNESGIVLPGPCGMIREKEHATVPQEYYDWYVSQGWAPERKVKPVPNKRKATNASNKKAVDNVTSFLD